MPLSLSKPAALPALVQVTLPSIAFRAENAAHGVSAMTPTPYGSFTTLMTPAALILDSSTASGAEPSTGARTTAPYNMPGTWTSML